MRLVALKKSKSEARAAWPRLVAVAGLAALLGGCSTMDAVGDGVVDAASAINPLNWFDDNDDKVASKDGGTTETAKKSDSGKDKNTEVTDINRQTDAKRKSRSGKAPSTMLYGDNRWDKSYPKLGDIPDRPTSDAAMKRRIEHKKLAEGLVADSKNAQYTEQVLKARVAVMPPPPTASPTTPVAARNVAAPKVSPPPASGSRITPPPAAPSAAQAAASAAIPPPAPAVVRAPVLKATPAVARTAVAPPAAIAAASPVAPSAPPQVASAPPNLPGRPQVPAPGVVPPPPPPSAYGVSAAGPQFATPVGVPRPSAVPAPQRAQNVSPPPAPPAYSETPAQASAPTPQPVAPAPQIAAAPANTVTGTPLPAGGGADYGRQQSVQVATIYFRNGSARLGARDRTVIRDVVAMFRETGGAIRIIGHSSGIAASQGSGRSKLVNFKVSLDRANAVAAELIRRGVPAEYIDVSAHGADNPLYAEYSATGAAGNRRAEVYLDYVGGS